MPLEAPAALVGRSVRKRFGKQYYGGTITKASAPKQGGKENVWWRIKYEDGDEVRAK